MYSLLLKGLFLGFLIAVPVGPIGLLCINKTMHKGKWSGFLSGLGAATADAFYAIIAAFGLCVVSNVLINNMYWIKTIGGLFLLYLGACIFLAKKNNSFAEPQSESLLEDYFSTFFLTIANPVTILSFTAILAGMGILGLNKSSLAVTVLVVGVFFGSALWWFLLSYIVSFLIKKSNEKFISLVNKISGISIILFGLFSLLR